MSAFSEYGQCILNGSSEPIHSDTLEFLRSIVKRVSLLRDNMKTLQENSEEIVARGKLKPKLRYLLSCSKDRLEDEGACQNDRSERWSSSQRELGAEMRNMDPRIVKVTLAWSC